ncbi:Hypothetical predicted protein [Podarcis lilfordi]|uniref:Uncharacterized protein n=1 Tax=Podarcis lilfordi TaxID=74358 RepID=A0AA35KLJ7_9SAUR|nr:Hypothetical predicted protein [Podarcis lilfordi]
MDKWSVHGDCYFNFYPDKTKCRCDPSVLLCSAAPSSEMHPEHSDEVFRTPAVQHICSDVPLSSGRLQIEK